MQGLTYQNHGLDLGVFNHRVGEQRVDGKSVTLPNGASWIYHNQAIIAPFSVLNTYINYTIRNRSIFDGTKIRLTANNLLDSHNAQSLSMSTKPVAGTIPGTSYTDLFTATTAISGADTPGLMAGRSFAVTATFGFAPRERK
jgi:hypothetical protein